MLGLVLLVACAGETATTTTTEMTVTTTVAVPVVTGTIELRPADWFGTPCEGKGGFDDIRPGANVVVKDGDSNTLGVNTLDEGEKVKPPGLGSDRCVFSFSVELVRESPFYTVEIAGRGGPTYTHADMVEDGWQVDLTLG